MDTVINFFALRPVFTYRGIQVVWYLYLLHTFIQLYVSLTEISRLLTQKGIGWEAWSPNLPPLLIGVAAQIAIVRLLIEVAASVLMTQRHGGSS